MFALFESLGGIELVVVGIGALLLFGKDLPKVAADAGAQFTKLKRSLDSTWRESGLDREMRQIRDALPRDLSLKDVARTASEKLAVRLEEEDRARQADPAQPGPVARGSSIDTPLAEPIEHAAAPAALPAPEVATQGEPDAAELDATAPRIDPASEFRAGNSARAGAPVAARPRDGSADSGGDDEPRPPTSVRA